MSQPARALKWGMLVLALVLHLGFRREVGSRRMWQARVSLVSHSFQIQEQIWRLACLMCKRGLHLVHCLRHTGKSWTGPDVFVKIPQI